LEGTSYHLLMSNADAELQSGLDALLALCARLPVIRVTFTLVAREPVLLPEGYAGNLVKGVLGAAVRKTLCLKRNTTCEECDLRSACPYSLLFEAPSAEPSPFKLARKPHPLVFEAPVITTPRLEPGDSFCFSTTLFGEGLRFLPFLSTAVNHAASAGIGKRLPPHNRRGRLKFAKLEQRLVSGKIRLLADSRRVVRSPVVETVADYAAFDLPCAPANVNVTFPLLLRLKSRGKPVNSPTLPQLLQATLRRLRMLLDCKRADSGYDERPLLQAAAASERLAAAFQKASWRRYSARQGRDLFLWGITGSAAWCNVPPEAVALLQVARLLHIGKGTIYGLGALKLEVQADDVVDPCHSGQ